MSDEDEKELRRLVRLLQDAVKHSGRSRRDVERSLRVGHGYLGHLFSGKMELKVRHVQMLGRELGFDAATFFHHAYPDTPQGRRVPSAGALLEGRQAAGSEGCVTREEVRAMIREELALRDAAIAAEPAPEARRPRAKKGSKPKA